MSKRQGFTLVELVVVLVILAVLAALAIPALNGYIDKANAAKCMTNRRYAYTDLTAAYLFDGEAALPSAHQSDLCQDPDYSQYQCPTHGKLSYKLNEEERQIEVFCSEHLKNSSLGNSNDMAIIMDTIKGVGYNLNSGAKAAGSARVNKLESDLKQLGFDLEALGAVSWNYNKSRNLLYWTDQDISQLEVGSEIAIIRYNPAYEGNEVYSVWCTKIKSKEQDGTAYNYFDDLTDNSEVYFKEYKPSLDAPKEDKTYEAALKWMADAQKELDKNK